MPNALNEAAPLLEKKGRLAYQIQDMSKRHAATNDESWTAEDLAQLDKLNKELEETQRMLDSMADERDNESDNVERRSAIETNTGVTQLEQVRSYELWKDAFRGYLLNGPQGMTERQREAYREYKKIAKRMEKRDQNVGTDADGGFTTHTQFIADLISRLEMYIGVSRIARVYRTDRGTDLYIPTDGPDLGEMVDEAGAVTADTGADIEFGQITLKAFKASSKMVRVSTELLEDTEIDLVGEIQRRLAERIGRTLEEKFTNGLGHSHSTPEPLGFAAAARSAKTVTISGGRYDPSYADYIDLYHALDPAYRTSPSCAFFMHDTLIARLRVLDTGTTDTNAVWQPSMQLGSPDRLLGKPLFPAQNMLAYTDTYVDGDPIACFGDFSRYGIRYVRGMRMRRTDDLYLANDQVGFVGFMRADGQPLFAVDESTSGASETSPILALTSDDGA